MKRIHFVIIIRFLLTGSFAFAQDEKTEVGVFGGGYFNSGFQSFKVLNPTTGEQVGTFKPVSEANSGIFGLRSGYRFMPRLEAEGTFGFSPAGRSQNFLGGIPTSIVQVQPAPTVPIALRSPVLGDGNVYLYSGTLLTYLNRQGTWRPFFTAGAGGITRTAKSSLFEIPYCLFLEERPCLLFSRPQLFHRQLEQTWPSCSEPDSRNTCRTDWEQGWISAITSTNSIKAQ